MLYASNTKILYWTKMYKLKKAHYSVKPHFQVMPLDIHGLLMVVEMKLRNKVSSLTLTLGAIGCLLCMIQHLVMKNNCVKLYQNPFKHVEDRARTHKKSLRMFEPNM